MLAARDSRRKRFSGDGTGPGLLWAEAKTETVSDYATIRSRCLRVSRSGTMPAVPVSWSDAAGHPTEPWRSQLPSPCRPYRKRRKHPQRQNERCLWTIRFELPGSSDRIPGTAEPLHPVAYFRCFRANAMFSSLFSPRIWVPSTRTGMQHSSTRS